MRRWIWPMQVSGNQLPKLHVFQKRSWAHDTQLSIQTVTSSSKCWADCHWLWLKLDPTLQQPR